MNSQYPLTEIGLADQHVFVAAGNFDYSLDIV